MQFYKDVDLRTQHSPDTALTATGIPELYDSHVHQWPHGDGTGQLNPVQSWPRCHVPPYQLEQVYLSPKATA